MAFDSSLHYKDQGSMQGSYTIMVAASGVARVTP